MMIRVIAAWLLAVVLFASAAHAHGGVGMQDNRCVLRIGPDLMFFTGYQPQNSQNEFCDDIPNTGQTVVVLDMQDTEFRDMLTEIRIIRDEGTHTRMNGLPFLTDAELASPQAPDPVTIDYVAPKKYPTGTLTFTHTFPENAKFIGIVTVKNEHGQTYVSQFPFSVGVGFGKSWGHYASMGAALAAGFTCFGTLAGSRSPLPRKSQREIARMLQGWPVFAEPGPRRGFWPTIFAVERGATGRLWEGTARSLVAALS